MPGWIKVLSIIKFKLKTRQNLKRSKLSWLQSQSVIAYSLFNYRLLSLCSLALCSRISLGQTMDRQSSSRLQSQRRLFIVLVIDWAVIYCRYLLFFPYTEIILYSREHVKGKKIENRTRVCDDVTGGEEGDFRITSNHVTDPESEPPPPPLCS